MREPGQVAAAAAVVAMLFAAGCGSSDKPASVADAKAKLSKDCQEGKSSDKPLCDCIADELASGNRTAKQITDLGNQVNDGKTPKEVLAASKACGKKLSQ